MSEVATSIFNKNSLLYGSIYKTKPEGAACVDGKGEETSPTSSKPTEAPIKAVREK